MAKRLLTVIPVMFIVSLIAFSLLYLVPGDVAVTLAGEGATPAQIDAIRTRLGTGDPMIVQYGRWMGHVLVGNLGRSLFSSQAVTSAIAERLPVTLTLACGALLVALIVGLPAGLLAGVRRGSWVDRLVTLGASTGLALPSYFVGMLLIITLSLRTGWFPATGYTPFGSGALAWFKHLALPSIALGLVPAAVLARQLRSALIGVLSLAYVRTAEAKGLRRHQVLLKHALKNASIPAVTAVATQFALVVGGTVVVEQIFAIPGMGALAVNAVLQRDVPLVQGIVLTTALMVQVVNIAVDVLYGYLNPRVRMS